MKVKNIYLGYWYQRTTLHLSEVYDFLSGRTSPLDLDPQKLKNFQTNLDISGVEMKIGYLEYIEAESSRGIRIRIDEDGLVIFSLQTSGDLKKDFAVINSYFHDKFLPAMDFIFSLGAPLPEVLSDIKIVSPYFVEVSEADDKIIDKFFADFKQSKYYEIIAEGIKIYRGGNIFLLSPDDNFRNINELIDMQVFFREFKAQLHRYLNIHRAIWEKVARIKENRVVRGGDIEDLRTQLESYKRTVDLVAGRIEQMGAYISSREDLVKNLGWEEFLVTVLQFKYHTLYGTLEYIKAVWQMTQNYINSAISIFSEVQATSTKDSIRALTMVTVVGVIATVLRLFVSYKEPLFTGDNLFYLLAVVVLAWLVHRLVQGIYKRKKYKIKEI